MAENEPNSEILIYWIFWRRFSDSGFRATDATQESKPGPVEAKETPKEEVLYQHPPMMIVPGTEAAGNQNG
jgi:hypothetical protein